MSARKRVLQRFPGGKRSRHRSHAAAAALIALVALMAVTSPRDVLRALLAGLAALEQTAARAQRRSQLPDNVGRAWTTDEESRLVSAFKKGDLAVAIAHEHGRTLRAIEARLEKLGLITAEQRTTRGGFTGTN